MAVPEAITTMTESSSFLPLAGVALLVLAAALVYYFLFYRANSKDSNASSSSLLKKSNSDVQDSADSKKKEASAALLDKSNSVSVEDMVFFARKLRPTSTHMDILFATIAAPEMVAAAVDHVERVEQLRAERKKELEEEENKKKQKKAKNPALDFDSLLEDDGWDEGHDDDDDDANDHDDEERKARRRAEQEALKRAKQEEEEKKLEMERLKQATGQVKQKLEGIDEGVLGQKWVERTLEQHGAWPPRELNTSSIFQKDDNDLLQYQGKVLSSVLDHPGLRRNLCVLAGRMHSQLLNSHPELMEAGSQKLTDATYFQAAMELRQRVGMMLEAVLRMAMMLRSFPLLSTTVEAVAQFKLGCRSDQLPWFNGMMARQYDTLPRLKIISQTIETAESEDVNMICAKDKTEITLELERTHAEKFLKQKLELCQQQGIPPQVALQTYREGWWLLLRAERIDNNKGKSALKVDDMVEPLDRSNPILATMDDKDIDKFEKEQPAEQTLLAGWPLVVSNIAQKSGKAKLIFPAPVQPGKYRFHVAIKSQDFLGADQEIVLEATIQDPTTVTRKPPKPQETTTTTAVANKEKENANDDDSGEPKKDK